MFGWKQHIDPIFFLEFSLKAKGEEDIKIIYEITRISLCARDGPNLSPNE